MARFLQQFCDRVRSTGTHIPISKRASSMANIDTTLGELISVFYEEFMEIYGDEDIASVAAAAVINDLLSDVSSEGIQIDDEEAVA